MQSTFPARVGSAHHVVNIDAIGYFGFVINSTIAVASAAWPTTNKIFYVPLRVSAPLLVRQLYVQNGTAVSGNVEIGLYTLDGTRLATSGSTAQSGTSTVQFFNITDVLIGRGAYYLALALDNTAGTVFRAAVPIVMAQLAGVNSETPGAFALPAVATPVTLADAFVPVMGLLAGTVL